VEHALIGAQAGSRARVTAHWKPQIKIKKITDQLTITYEVKWLNYVTLFIERHDTSV